MMGGEEMSRLGKIKKDLVGRKIGCLTVLDEYRRHYVSRGTTISWKCRCDCGNEYFVYRDSLIKGKFDYCPCCRPKGVRNTKLYKVYNCIKQRCYNPNNPSYRKYGAKGVKMCDEWLNSYEVFHEWATEHGYIPDVGLSIDRIDSNGNYCPENCQWITRSENTARSNYGRQQVFTKLKDVYAVSPEGERVDITNITKFCRDNGLNLSNISAALHGRLNPLQNGWLFHSDKTRPDKKSVTTIESIE